ncbi:unnamed protein product [Rhizophagus irregularis]|nr:unnamed protein product [Rhizophagus irregularis]
MKPAIFTLVFAVLIARSTTSSSSSTSWWREKNCHSWTWCRSLYTLNNGSIPIPIDDKYIPGTNYITEVGLKPADPTIKGIGSVFTVTEGGDGPAAPELGLLGTPANNPPPPDKPPTATPAPPPGKLGICTQI